MRLLLGALLTFAVAAATLPFSALAAVSTAYLQAHGRFAVPAAGTLLFNTALVAAIVFFVHPGLLLPIAVAAVVGSVIRWFSQILATRAVHDVGPPAGLRQEELPALASRYLQALAATGLVVLVPYAARTIASLGEPGDIAVLTYASRIVELPLGAFLTVGSIALLPHISERFAIGDREGALRLGRGGLVASHGLRQCDQSLQSLADDIGVRRLRLVWQRFPSRVKEWLMVDG